MQEIRPRSWESLLEALFAHSWQAGLARHRLTCAFRGAPLGEPLTPPLVRMGGRFREVEQPMLRAFRKYALDEKRCDSVWEWMALAQHHGLPTRLLDWTHSPFVALHFATVLGGPGVIWRANYRASNATLPARLRQALRREGADVFTAELLASVTDSLDGLERLSRRPFALFFEPPSLDARIVNQFALFSLTSEPGARLEDLLGDSVRILLSPELTAQARDFLDQANVNERVLFPGLDGLTSYLARYYRPVDGRIRSHSAFTAYEWTNPSPSTASSAPIAVASPPGRSPRASSLPTRSRSSTRSPSRRRQPESGSRTSRGAGPATGTRTRSRARSSPASHSARRGRCSSSTTRTGAAKRSRCARRRKTSTPARSRSSRRPRRAPSAARRAGRTRSARRARSTASD